MVQVPQLYQNLELGYWQTRVLILKTGSFEDDLEATLRVADLLHGPELRLEGDETPVQFIALSYCWGDPKMLPCTISCNNITHRIGREASQALRRLRSAHHDIYVWIDAICIDQKNTEEKAVQVPRMLSVYSKASEVVIWLGEGSADTRLLLYDLQHKPSLAQERQFNKYAEELDRRGFEVLSLKDIRPVGTATPEARVRAMGELLANPWFGRVWTKQETWAARKATLRCGEVSCDWECLSTDTFERLLGVPLDKSSGVAEVCKKLDDVRGRHQRADISALARTQADDLCNPFLEDDRDHELDIVNVIRRHNGSKCSNLRDHVYGLVGMSSINVYNHDEDDGRKEMLSINYSEQQDEQDEESEEAKYLRSVAYTFEDLARYIIGRDESLSILFLEGAFERRQSEQGLPDLPLPTWVPDWRYLYGSLAWLTETESIPLSRRSRNYVEMGGKADPAKPLARVQFPLSIGGFALGTYEGDLRNNLGDSDSANRSNFLGLTPISHMKYGAVMMDSSIKSGLSSWAAEQQKPFGRDLEPFFGIPKEIICLVPTKAQPGDIALAVHGAYAPLLVRPAGEKRGESMFQFVGPAVLLDYGPPLVSLSHPGPLAGKLPMKGQHIIFYLSNLLLDPSTSIDRYRLV